MTREKFKIVSGQPLVVTLDRGEAKEVKSDYVQGGKEFRFEVSRNGKPGYVYLEPAGRNALIRTRITEGEDFQILKTGQNGHTQWRIDPVSDAVEEEPAPVPARPAKPIPAAAPTQHTASHPIQERMKRLCKAAAYALRDAHAELLAEGFQLENPNWEDIRCVAIHWNISAEKGAR